MIEFRFASLQRPGCTFRFRDGDGWNFLLLVLVGVRLSGSGFSACGSEGQKKVCGGDSGGWLQGSMWCSIVGERFAELLGCVFCMFKF